MRARMMLAGGGVLAAVSVAAAQASPYTIEIHVDSPIIEPGETATIELRCGFDSDAYWAMAYAWTDLTGFAHAGMIESVEILEPMRGPGTEPGSFDGASVLGIIGGQLQSPTAGIWADPDDPAPLWRGVLRAAPADERVVLRISTDTDRYGVFLRRLERETHEKLDELVEGHTTITIVPCRADLDGDGVATLFDFLAFQNAFDAGDPLADFDFDGELTVFDFLAFQNRFDLGC